MPNVMSDVTLAEIILRRSLHPFWRSNDRTTGLGCSVSFSEQVARAHPFWLLLPCRQDTYVSVHFCHGPRSCSMTGEILKAGNIRHRSYEDDCAICEERNDSWALQRLVQTDRILHQRDPRLVSSVVRTYCDTFNSRLLPVNALVIYISTDLVQYIDSLLGGTSLPLT